MITWEQKGCGTGSSAAKHYLLMDKGIMLDSKNRTGLAMESGL